MTHPITPPAELVQEWYNDKTDYFYDINRAAQWGADQELEACCEWLDERFRRDPFFSKTFRAARRPKPPSLKEQALKELAWIAEHLGMPLHNHCNAIHTIHRALEALPE
jgi:hypothetical protein